MLKLNNLMSDEDLAMYRNMLPQGDEASNVAAQAVRMLAAQRAAERPAAKMRRKYEGPWRGRPVVNGRAMVSAEELADFRRQYGPQMTLRDLLNADRGAGPSAADPRARGMQGANTAPQDPSRLLEGVAAAQRAIAQPGRDAIEGFYPELAVIPAMRLLMGAGRAAAPAAAPIIRNYERVGVSGALRPSPELQLYLQGTPSPWRMMRPQVVER